MFSIKTVKKLTIFALFITGTACAETAVKNTDIRKDLFGVTGFLLALRTGNVVLSTVHELGHAIPARLFYNNPIHIRIGSPESKRLYPGKYMTVKRDCFMPSHGQFGLMTWQIPKPEPEGFRAAALYGGGPMAGALLMAGALYGAKKFEERGVNQYSALAYAGVALGATMELASLIPGVHHIDTNQNTDGGYLCGALKFSDRARNVLRHSVRGAIAGTWMACGAKLWDMYQDYKVRSA